MARRDKNWLSAPQVAEMFGVHPDTIRRYVEQGKLKPVNKPSLIVQRQHWYFDPAYIAKIMEEGLPQEDQPQNEAA